MRMVLRFSGKNVVCFFAGCISVLLWLTPSPLQIFNFYHQPPLSSPPPPPPSNQQQQTGDQSSPPKIEPPEAAKNPVKNDPTYEHLISYDGITAQDDPQLVQAVAHIFEPPSEKPYNFENPTLTQPEANPSPGQIQAVQSILRGFGSNGFFLECGAGDGERYSNTIWAEVTLGWTGLLIEADTRSYSKLREKNRKAFLANTCVANVPHPRKLTFYSGQSPVNSGLIASKAYGAVNGVQRNCLPLYTLMLALNRTTIDLFVLDVNGSELDILLTLPFESVLFKVISVEHSVMMLGKSGLIEVMEQRDYIFYRTIANPQAATGASIFIHKSVDLTPEQRASIGVEGGDLRRTPRDDRFPLAD